MIRLMIIQMTIRPEEKAMKTVKIDRVIIITLMILVQVGCFKDVAAPSFDVSELVDKTWTLRSFGRVWEQQVP